MRTYADAPTEEEPLPPRPTDAGPRRAPDVELEDPDREETLEAARQEVPTGVIKPNAWNSRVRRLRPRYVAAYVLTVVTSTVMVAVGFSAAFTDVSNATLTTIGTLAVAGALVLLGATWSEERTAAWPRIALGSGAAIAFIAVALWALSL